MLNMKDISSLTICCMPLTICCVPWTPHRKGAMMIIAIYAQYTAVQALIVNCTGFYTSDPAANLYTLDLCIYVAVYSLLRLSLSETGTALEHVKVIRDLYLDLFLKLQSMHSRF